MSQLANFFGIHENNMHFTRELHAATRTPEKRIDHADEFSIATTNVGCQRERGSVDPQSAPTMPSQEHFKGQRLTNNTNYQDALRNICREAHAEPPPT